MTKDPVTATGEDLLIQARLKMQKGGFRRLPVVSDGQLVGIISDRDMRQHAGYLDRTEVKAAMSQKPITVTPATTVEAAAQLLLKQKIGGLPVADKGRLVGMITTSDILQAFLRSWGRQKTSTRIDACCRMKWFGRSLKDRFRKEVLSVGSYRGKWGKARYATCVALGDRTRLPKSFEIEVLRYWGVPVG
jgi:acetoin utilization protein AcuB